MCLLTNYSDETKTRCETTCLKQAYYLSLLVFDGYFEHWFTQMGPARKLAGTWQIPGKANMLGMQVDSMWCFDEMSLS